ncbi:MAG TPA: hypothetical protein VL992_10440 [Tepidisphaeraceae bacterium]|nr:hypothetical protein [Tepidisphaeraceae bacterium]
MRAKRTTILCGLTSALLGLSTTALAMEPWESAMSGPGSELATPKGASFLDDQTSAQIAKQGDSVIYADAAPSGPNIHGFAAATVSTDYITPRGLVVADEDTVVQPIVGLVFPIGDLGPLKNFTFVGGLWNCVTFVQQDPHVGPWNELDDFFSISFDPFIPNLNAALTYVAFNSPTGAYDTEHNSDLKLSYDDKSFWGGNFGIEPYVDLWWAMAGSSTVVAGKPGDTGYAEIGVVPTYTVKAIPSYPVTLKVPTYISVGPKDYWSYDDIPGTPTGGSWGDGNVGVFSTGLSASIPLNIIPVQYGYWHLDAGITYFDLISNGLVFGGELASGNTRRDLIMGTITLGVNF